MSNILKGSLIKVKPGVYYQGNDLSRKEGIVLDVSSYIEAKIDGIEYPVKLLQYEVNLLDRRKLRQEQDITTKIFFRPATTTEDDIDDTFADMFVDND